MTEAERKFHAMMVRERNELLRKYRAIEAAIAAWEGRVHGVWAQGHPLSG
jgi:hypothetical protein